MKILHVVDRMDPKAGGVCQAIRMIVDSLSQVRVTSEVVSVDADSSSFNDPFKIHALGPANNAWQFSKKLLPWLICNLGNYDSVIIHGMWQYYGFATYRALKDRDGDKPLVYLMPHGMLDPYFQNAPDRKLKAIRNRVYWSLIERHVIKKCNALLFTCRTEMELARIPFKPYAPANERIVGLGIKSPPKCTETMINSFYKAAGMSIDENFILYLGRLHSKKGIDILIHAYIELLEVIQLPKLVIAGPGIESDYGKDIKRLIAKRPELQSYFVFTGMLEGDAKWGAFYACETFILPSHQENFGIATVEALACGKPVLISNQVNIFNEIQDYDAGFIGTDTIEGTTDLLQSWASLSSKEKRLKSMNALKCYQEKFTEHTVAENIIALMNLNYENRLLEYKV